MEQEIVLCDTDVMIEYLNKNIEVYNWFHEFQIQNLFISAITKAELQQGCGNKRELNKLNKALDKFMIVDIDYHISTTFSTIFETHVLSHQSKIPDALNAATALYYDVLFFTLNTKDYRYYKDIRLVKHHIKPVKKSK